MSYSKVKIEGNNEKEMLDSLFEQCSNNNQVCYHLRKNPSLTSFIKKETKLNLDNVMQLLYHYREGINEIPKCLCGKKRKYHCYGYRPTCTNKKCINIERESSKKEYCLKNYGIEYVTQLDSMKEKSKKTLLEKYGVDNITKLPEVIKRRKQNNKRKWGVEDPISLNYIRSKSLSDSDRGLEKIQSGLHEFEIGKSVLYLRKKNNIEICNQCNTSIGSNGEQEVFDYILSIYDGNISRSNRRLMSPYEIDIVLPDLKICIEFNGDYWHSTNVNNDPNYHLNKTLLCSRIGYDLLQIRENDWNLNKEEIKRKLYNRINNIYDKRDLNIDGNYLIFDMSWYDSRILEDLLEEPIEYIEPKLIDSGQYKQWDCGYKLFKIF